MAVSSVINVKANPKIQEFGPGDSVKVNYRGPGGGAGANSGLPGCGHQATRGRSRARTSRFVESLRTLGWSELFPFIRPE